MILLLVYILNVYSWGCNLGIEKILIDIEINMQLYM